MSTCYATLAGLGSFSSMRRLAISICGLSVVAVMAVAAPVSGGYVRFSCGGHGISSPLAATNGQGETLLVWQDGQQSAGGFCESTVADAVVGSTRAGYTDLGTISEPSKLSYATGVSLDGAGDGWVIGLHEVYAGSNKYGPDFEKSGVWAAFRPAGAGFRAPVELPIETPVQETEAWVAGNRAGRTLLAWSNYNGTYLAFGTSTGVISKPTFIGGGFRIAGLGVDESGRALVVGYYYAKNTDEVVRIAAVTAGASGLFSRPRILARRMREARKHLVSYFEPPLVTVGPRGNAVIAYESTWANRRTEYEFAGPTLLIYRRADGHYDKAVRLPNGFLAQSDAAMVDGAGRAILVSPTTDNGLKEIAISPDDRVGRQHRLGGFVEDAGVVGDPLGQAVIVWINVIRPVKVVLGNTRGISSDTQTVGSLAAGVTDCEVIATMSPQGTATVFWVEEPKKEEKILYAQAITPGAQPVKVASSEPVPSVP
jgi:hypothetical protein